MANRLNPPAPRVPYSAYLDLPAPINARTAGRAPQMSTGGRIERLSANASKFFDAFMGKRSDAPAAAAGAAPHPPAGGQDHNHGAPPAAPAHPPAAGGGGAHGGGH